jgi:hypothetical protein
MNLQHPAPVAHRPDGLEEPAIIEPEVVDHECLRGRHPRLDERRELADRVVHGSTQHEAHAVVDHGIAVGPFVPFLQARHERSGAGLADPARGRREGEERRRATERGRDGILEEPVGLGVGRKSGVRVDVDTARQDEKARGVDDPVGPVIERRADRRDSAIVDGHVRPERSLGRHDGPAPNDEFGHG